MSERNRSPLVATPEDKPPYVDIIHPSVQRLPEKVRIEVRTEDEHFLILSVFKEGHGQRLFLDEIIPSIADMEINAGSREIWVHRNEIKRGEAFSIEAMEYVHLARTAFVAKEISVKAIDRPNLTKE